MSKKNKILLLFPDGVGIRNYLYSDVVKHLDKDVRIVIWSPLPESVFEEVKILHNLNFEFKQIDLLPENLLTRLYRESATFARLVLSSKKTNNATILTNWNYHPKSLKLKFLNKISIYLGSWASKSYDRILKLESKAQNNWSQSIINKYKNDLEALNFSSIFIAHQRVAALMPICIAAKELNIPVVTAIYSWDNLPKARLAVQADKYLVWSDYMKEEMHFYYPEIAKDKVKVTGTPQFDFYNQKKNLLSRAEFALKYNLNPNKKWICFSGDDVKTSPYDANYLEDVAEAIFEIPEEIRPQIIFRRCPIDFSNRYDAVLEKHKKNITSINPIWNVPKSLESWGAFFPKKDDTTLLMNLAFHCELVINLGSTMAHDFAIYNKPCFYLNYNPVASKTWSVETIYKFQHFKSMEGLDAVGWLNYTNEIASKISEVIEETSKVAPHKTEWMQLVNTKSIEGSAQLIVNEILG